MGLLIAIVSGFASGIFFHSLFYFGWEPVVFLIFLALLFVGAAFIKPRALYLLCAVFFLFTALGMMRSSATHTPLPETFATQLRHRVSYEGVVVADPDVRDANQRVEVHVSNEYESTNILVVAPRSETVRVGDHVSVSGTLLVPEPFDTESGRVFRYDKYLERSGIRFILNFASIHVTEPAPWYSIPAALARAKHAFQDGLARTVPEPFASLGGGIVIGGKSGLGNELKDTFTRAGLIHIIVLSGHNVMVVAEWIMALLAFTKLSRRASLGAGAFAILIFVGIAGASATAIRAMCMALIALYARATGRTYAAGRALFFVAFLMLLWNPLYLIFDPGFGLSMAATAGLIWLAPLLETKLSFLKNTFWKDAVATTLAAQIFVLPLLLYNTGNLSIVSIPANLLAVPVVAVAMGFSAFAGFAGMLFGTFAPLIGIMLSLPAYIANAYLIYIAQKAAELPFAAFMLPPFPFWLVLVSYAALIYIVSSKRFSITDQLRFARNASM